MEDLELIQDNSVGDNLHACIDYGGAICIEVEEPWSGDTETGFGRSGAVRLTREQALELADWLAKASEELGPRHP